MLYKFTPEWTLDFAHLLVNHADGIATPYEFTHDSINPLFRYYARGLSYDDEENMYLSGRIELVLNTASHGGNLHNYPAHIWWDGATVTTLYTPPCRMDASPPPFPAMAAMAQTSAKLSPAGRKRIHHANFLKFIYDDE